MGYLWESDQRRGGEVPAALNEHRSSSSIEAEPGDLTPRTQAKELLQACKDAGVNL